MKNFEPVALFVKQNEIDQQISNISTPIDAFQAILNITKKLECEPFTTDEFVNLFVETKKTLFKKLTQNKENNVLGLEVDPEKMFDIIAKPDAVGEILAQIEALNKNPETQFYSRRITQFEVINGDVVLKPELIDGIVNQCTVFATTPEDMNIYTTLKQIETSINELQTNRTVWHLHDKMFTEIFNYNTNTHRLDLKKDFLRVYR